MQMDSPDKAGQTDISQSGGGPGRSKRQLIGRIVDIKGQKRDSDLRGKQIIMILTETKRR